MKIVTSGTVTKFCIAILIYLFSAGCSSSRIPQQDFIDQYTESLFLSGYVQQTFTGRGGCLGYYDKGYEVIRESFSENVKQAGLILDAKSILSTTSKSKTDFGNDSANCSLLFNRTVNNTRNGRSALASILNFSSAIKGDPYTPQDKPDTSIRSIVSEGTIMLKDEIAGFYYKRNYRLIKNVSYEGWLVIRGDTIVAKQVKNKGNGNDNRNSYYWLQLIKNDRTYAALNVSNTLKMKLYILKGLSESEKMFIAAYFAVIVYNSE